MRKVRWTHASQHAHADRTGRAQAAHEHTWRGTRSNASLASCNLEAGCARNTHRISQPSRCSARLRADGCGQHGRAAAVGAVEARRHAHGAASSRQRSGMCTVQQQHGVGGGPRAKLSTRYEQGHAAGGCAQRSGGCAAASGQSRRCASGVCAVRVSPRGHGPGVRAWHAHRWDRLVPEGDLAEDPARQLNPRPKSCAADPAGCRRIIRRGRRRPPCAGPRRRPRRREASAWDSCAPCTSPARRGPDGCSPYSPRSRRSIYARSTSRATRPRSRPPCVRDSSRQRTGATRTAGARTCGSSHSCDPPTSSPSQRRADSSRPPTPHSLPTRTSSRRRHSCASSSSDRTPTARGRPPPRPRRTRWIRTTRSRMKAPRATRASARSCTGAVGSCAAAVRSMCGARRMVSDRPLQVDLLGSPATSSRDAHSRALTTTTTTTPPRHHHHHNTTTTGVYELLTRELVDALGGYVLGRIPALRGSNRLTVLEATPIRPLTSLVITNLDHEELM